MFTLFDFISISNLLISWILHVVGVPVSLNGNLKN